MIPIHKIYGSAQECLQHKLGSSDNVYKNTLKVIVYGSDKQTPQREQEIRENMDRKTLYVVIDRSSKGENNLSTCDDGYISLAISQSSIVAISSMLVRSLLIDVNDDDHGGEVILNAEGLGQAVAKKCLTPEAAEYIQEHCHDDNLCLKETQMLEQRKAYFNNLQSPFFPSDHWYEKVEDASTTQAWRPSLLYTVTTVI
jgi:hypothetical protein